MSSVHTNIPLIPLLRGMPTISELNDAIKRETPLSLGIPLAVQNEIKICQLKCKYCFVEKETRKAQLALKDHFYIIDRFAEIGGRYIKTATVGEPFLDKKFFDSKGEDRFPLIDHANSKDLYWTSYSNLLSITPEIAKQLSKRKFSIIGKLNSLNPNVQEATTGRTGFYNKRNWVKFKKWIIPKHLKYLIDAGFNKRVFEKGRIYTRLGVEVIITKDNFRDIPLIVKFCIENNIYPDLETLEIAGDAKTNLTDLQLSTKENRWLYNQLKDMAPGDWLEKDVRIAGAPCSMYVSGIVYNVDGSIRYCYNVDSKLRLNIRTTSLKKLYLKLLCNKKQVSAKMLLKSRKKRGLLNPCPISLY